MSKSGTCKVNGDIDDDDGDDNDDSGGGGRINGSGSGGGGSDCDSRISEVISGIEDEGYISELVGGTEDDVSKLVSCVKAGECSFGENDRGIFKLTCISDDDGRISELDNDSKNIGRISELLSNSDGDECISELDCSIEDDECISKLVSDDGWIFWTLGGFEVVGCISKFAIEYGDGISEAVSGGEENRCIPELASSRDVVNSISDMV